MEKPEACLSCGNALQQPATGRPRSYCGVLCRRAAEYELRRVQSMLLQAERRELRAREEHELESYDRPATRRALKWWAGEVERLRARQRALLASVGDGAGDGERDSPAASQS